MSLGKEYATPALLCYSGSGAVERDSDPRGKKRESNLNLGAGLPVRRWSASALKFVVRVFLASFIFVMSDSFRGQMNHGY